MSITPRLTNAGRGLLIRALSGETINFTRLKIGSGDAPSEPFGGDYWYSTSERQLYVYTESWASETRSFTYNANAPGSPSAGDLWFDRTVNLLKEYVYSWLVASSQITVNVSAGSSEPANPASGDYWVDTANRKLKVYGGSSWSEYSGSTFTFAAVAPSNSSAGDYWYNTANGYLYKYVADWNNSLESISFTEPGNPAKGDLWYDATAGTLEKWATTWTASAETITRSTIEPASPSTSDLWRDTANGVLYRFNGAAWVTVTDAGYTESSAQPGNSDELTDLINAEMSLNISAFSKGENYVSLTSLFDNSGVSASFPWTETGVYAKGSDGVEVLYAYRHSGGEYDTIPANSIGRTVAITLTVLVAVDDAREITAVIGEGALFATQEEFNDHIRDYNNPHRVTKQQVGLGNVPNLAPENFELNYETPTALVAPTPGEKLVLFMGKVRRAVIALIEHLQARNPHGITCDKIGAAKADHKHKAEDITDLVAQVTTSNGLPDTMGFYTGTEKNSNSHTGSSSDTYQTINVGFKPSKVVVIKLHMGSDRTVGGGTAWYFEPGKHIYHAGCGDAYYTISDTSKLLARRHGCAFVTNNGFTVQNGPRAAWDQGYAWRTDINLQGCMYLYMAWK